MEKHFPEIKKLVVIEGYSAGKTVADPEKYFMQYVGIVLNGKKLIYINAFPDPGPDGYWKEHTISICDGGNSWGVLYDPTTGQFFDLAINRDITGQE